MGSDGPGGVPAGIGRSALHRSLLLEACRPPRHFRYLLRMESVWNGIHSLAQTSEETADMAASLVNSNVSVAILLSRVVRKRIPRGFMNKSKPRAVPRATFSELVCQAISYTQLPTIG